MTETETTEAWRLIRPEGEAGAAVFASPHSGALYPDDMAPAPGLTMRTLRGAEDALVDHLAEAGPRHGAPLLAGVVGRSYLDLNRAENELDPLLIEGVGAARATPMRTAAGYGVVARLGGDGRPLYDRRVSQAEAEVRLSRYHRPYHRKLAELMTAARERRGRAVLVDWHSMPSRGAGGARAVDVCLGDRRGTACDPRLMRRLRALFEAEGLTVALNHPYAGGYATSLWGRPEEGFHAVQIELNRALYLDEARLAPGPGWTRCLALVERTAAALCAEVEALTG